MVEPVTMALMAASVGQGILGAFESNKINEYRQAQTEATIQYYQDLIVDTRLKAAREVREAAGTGVVAAGGRGVQFSGSIVETTRKAIGQVELEKLQKIRDLKFRQVLTALGQQQADTQTGLNQIGSVLGGAAGAVKVSDQAGLKKDIGTLNKKLENLGTDVSGRVLP